MRYVQATVELVYVFTLDLVEAGEVLAERVAAVEAPIAGVRRLGARRYADPTGDEPAAASSRVSFLFDMLYSCAVISPRAVRPRLGVLGYIFAGLWLVCWSIANAQSAADPAASPLRHIGLASVSCFPAAVREVQRT